jgi:hypothetical protein
MSLKDFGHGYLGVNNMMFLFGVFMLLGTILDFTVKMVRHNTFDLGNVLMILFISLALPYLG